MQNLKRGSVQIANPFNPRQIRSTDLRPEAVHAIVFWTRYPQPLLKYLPDLIRAGYQFVFQFTLTGYPKIFEPGMPPLEKSISLFKKLADMIGPSKVIWRYDPIVISDITDENFHTENFGKLADSLHSHTGRIVVSHLDFYRKLAPRFNRLAKQNGIKIIDVLQNPKRALRLLTKIKQIADDCRLLIQTCAEDKFLAKSGIPPGACIDGPLLSELTGRKIIYKKDKHQRPNCRCTESVDIGSYDSCRFGCIYCYAIR